MPEVDIIINNREHKIACSEGEENRVKELAALLNCKNLENLDSCGLCSSCIKIKNFKHENINLLMPLPRGNISSSSDSSIKAFKNEKAFQDYLELLSKKSNDPYYKIKIRGANTILINSIRDIKQNITKSTFNDSWKTILIFDADKLCVPNPSAGHAILKILEEPPDKTLFVLVSSSEDLILDTIKSRCQSIFFPSISDKIIKQNLLNDGYSEDQANIISKICNGNISLSKELANNYLDLMKKMYILLNSFFSKDFLIWEKAIDIISRFKQQDMYFLDQLFNLLISFFRDLHYYSVTGEEKNIIHINFIKKIMDICKNKPQADWAFCIEHIENTRDYIVRNGNISLMAINMILDIQDSINGINKEKFNLSDWVSI